MMTNGILRYINQLYDILVIVWVQVGKVCRTDMKYAWYWTLYHQLLCAFSETVTHSYKQI